MNKDELASYRVAASTLQRQSRIDAVSTMIGARAKKDDSLSGKSKLPSLSLSLKNSKSLPVEEDDAITTVEDDSSSSLHAYLRIPKSQKLTKEDLEKAKKKAEKDGNEAILKKIAAVSRFIGKGPKSSSKAKRGFAIYNGIKKSHRAVGIPARECVSVTWGGLEYFYISSKMSNASIDNKLSSAFAVNPTAAGVLVNKLVKEKKLQVYLRWDIANSKPHIAAQDVTAAIDMHYTNDAYCIEDLDAHLIIDSGLFVGLYVKSNNRNLIMISGEHAERAIAEGIINLSNLRQSLYDHGIKSGAFTYCEKSANVPTIKPDSCCAPQAGLSSDDLTNAVRNLDGSIAKANDERFKNITKMFCRDSSGGSIRVLESSNIAIELYPIDWSLVKHVVDDKLQKALVSNQQWIVSKNGDNVRFKSAKPGLVLEVNADLMILKLKKGR
jgi:hypothetical protein